MIHARRDKRTRHRVYCGGRGGTCPHEFGRLHDPLPHAGGPAALVLHDDGNVISAVKKCPLCGEPNVIDIYELLKEPEEPRTL